jgi:hypothetical protein
MVIDLLAINFMLLLSFECTLDIINDLREKSAFDSLFYALIDTSVSL